jgi:hypothetical protein
VVAARSDQSVTRAVRRARAKEPAPPPNADAAPEPEAPRAERALSKRTKHDPTAAPPRPHPCPPPRRPRTSQASSPRPPARLHGRGGGSLRSRARRPSLLGRRDAAVVERGARVGGRHRRGGARAADVRPDVGGRAAGGGAGTGARARRALHPGGAAPLRPRPLALRLHRHPPRPPR